MYLKKTLLVRYLLAFILSCPLLMCFATEEGEPLKVVLYDFIPDLGQEDFGKLKVILESDLKKNGIEANIRFGLPDGRDIYQESDLKKALKTFDVVEIDTVLFDAIKDHTKPWSKDAWTDSFHPAFKKFLYSGEAPIAIPHWMCGNFLFTKNNYEPKKSSTAFNFMGTYESGSSYLNVWAETSFSGSIDDQINKISKNELDPSIVSTLKTQVDLCKLNGHNPSTDKMYKVFYKDVWKNFSYYGIVDSYMGFSESLSEIKLSGKVHKYDTQTPNISHKVYGDKAKIFYSDAFVLSKESENDEKAKEFALHMSKPETLRIIMDGMDVEKENRVPRYLIPANRKAELYSEDEVFSGAINNFLNAKNLTPMPKNTSQHIKIMSENIKKAVLN